MAIKRLGSQTVKLLNPPAIVSTASIVGPKEGKGPLASYFDHILKDDLFGEESWEKAESKMVQEAVRLAVSRQDLKLPDIDYMLGGGFIESTNVYQFCC